MSFSNSKSNEEVTGLEIELAAKRLWLFTKDRPTVTEGNRKTYVVSIKREFLAMHAASRVHETIKQHRCPIQYDEKESIGPATFYKVLAELDIYTYVYANGSNLQVLDTIIKDGCSYEVIYAKPTRLLEKEQFIGSGCSFSVSCGKAEECPVPPNEKSPENYWEKGSLLALKRAVLSGGNDRASGSLLARVVRDFIQELRILSHGPLRGHPNIIHLHGIFWENQMSDDIHQSFPVLIQECADRGTLEQFLFAIRNRATYAEPFSWRRKIILCQQIASGLEALHSCGIVHADVKCKNILLFSNSRVVPDDVTAKICDFGCSVIIKRDFLNHDPKIEVVGGTEKYMAPEVFQYTQKEREGQTCELPQCSVFSIDIYSFGLTACTIALEGEDIFEAIKNREEGKTDVDVFMASKCGIEADSILVPGIQSVIGHLESKENIKIVPLLTSMLYFLPERRLRNLGEAREYFTSELEKHAENEDIDEDVDTKCNFDKRHECGELGSPVEYLGSQTKCGKPNSLPIRLNLQSNREDYNKLPLADLGGRLRIFYLDGVIMQASVREVCIEEIMNKNFQKEDYQVKVQIFDDLLSKANILTTSSDLSNISKEIQITAAFCAYQIFLCCFHGQGCKVDLHQALKYLMAAARGGYSIANFMILSLKKSVPELSTLDDSPYLEAQKALVSIGPRFGLFGFLVGSRFLREEFPEKYKEALEVLNFSGYSELGETPDCDGALDSETLLGSDIECQYIASGTHPWIIRTAAAKVGEYFIKCFLNGILPANQVNYNGESALYVCCRIGEAEKTLALLDNFEWARKTVTQATNTLRFPLHWLCSFKTEDVALVAKRLIDLGANVNATDREKLRAIDYAILANREDVIWILIEESILKYPRNLEMNGRTLQLACNFGGLSIAKHLLEVVDERTKLYALSKSAFYCHSTRCLALCGEAESRMKMVLSIMARLPGAEDNLYGILVIAFERGLPDLATSLFDGNFINNLQVSPSMSERHITRIFKAAITWSQELFFTRLLDITPNMSTVQAREIFEFIILNRGAQQVEVAEQFLSYLEERNLTREMINWQTPSSCQPSCTLDHRHVGSSDLLWQALKQGSSQLLDVVTPHLHKTTVFRRSTFCSILVGAQTNVIGQIEALFKAESAFPPQFVCDKERGHNVLHAAIMNHEKYRSATEFKALLEYLIRNFVVFENENINRCDNHGRTALHYAGYFGSIPALQVLLAHDSDPMLLDTRGVTSYDIASIRFTLSIHVFFKASVTANRFSIISVMKEQRPVETDEKRVAMNNVVGFAECLALLSTPAEEFDGFIENNGEEELVIVGFIPVTKSRKLFPAIDAENENPTYEAWSIVENREMPYRICTRLREDFKPYGKAKLDYEDIGGNAIVLPKLERIDVYHGRYVTRVAYL